MKSLIYTMIASVEGFRNMVIVKRSFESNVKKSSFLLQKDGISEWKVNFIECFPVTHFSRGRD